MSWPTVDLSGICVGDSPITYGILQPGPDLQDGVAYVRPSEIKDGKIVLSSIRRTSPQIAQRYEKSKIRTGDILITIVGTIGSIAVVPPELDGGNITQSSARIRVDPSIADQDFIKSFLRSDLAKRQYDRHRLGVAVPRLNLHHVRDLKIPLPPLAEQKRIAGILDAADALRAKRRESLAQLDTLLQSTFLDLFGDPVANPKGWEVKKLKELSTHIMNGTTPKGGKQVYKNEGITFFRSQNVWRNRIDYDDIAFLDDETHRKMLKSSLKNRDILITKTGRFNTENSSLGRAALFKGEDDSANINGHVYLVRLIEGAIHEFVLFILTSNEYREYIRRVCVGGIDKRQINKSHLDEFPIIQPPLPLQRRFAAIVASVEQQKTRMRAHLAELDALFASLQSRAFNGEL